MWPGRVRDAWLDRLASSHDVVPAGVGVPGSPANANGGKKLGWQNSLDQSIFKLLKICSRIVAEAATLRPHLLATLPAGAQLLPRTPIRGGQIRAVHWTLEPCRRCRHHSYGTAHHQTRRCHLPAAGPTLLIPLRPEELFQVVVRPRQIAHVRAMEQPRPVAPRHLAEVRG